MQQTLESAGRRSKKAAKGPWSQGARIFVCPTCGIRAAGFRLNVWDEWIEDNGNIGNNELEITCCFYCGQELLVVDFEEIRRGLVAL